MKIIINSFFTLISLLAINSTLAQHSLSTIQKSSYNEVITFSKESQPYIKSIANRIKQLKFEKQYKWGYYMAKPLYFKAIDKSIQRKLDSISTIILTALDSVNKPVTAVYFPEINGSNELHNHMASIQTDLLLQEAKDNNGLNILPYFEVEQFHNSNDFTLCEYQGILRNSDGLTLGNTIFMKKGALIIEDLSEMIPFFDGLPKDLRGKGIKEIDLAIYFQNKQSRYAGLFKIKNGNLIGELQRLGAKSSFSNFLVKSTQKNKTITEVYMVSNIKIDVLALQKNMVRKEVVLKKLEDNESNRN